MANFVAQKRLTMLTAAETKQLSNVAAINLAEDETLIYKYRDEFLHIQRVAEQGITQLDMLIEDPNEFNILATAWGFVCTVEDKFESRIQYRKNLGQQQVLNKLSNIRVDWRNPQQPTVDVEQYRASGNLVSLLDSTLFVPKVDLLKQQLNVTDTEDYVPIRTVTAKAAEVAALPLKTAAPPAEPVTQPIPSQIENFGVQGSNGNLDGGFNRFYFQIVASAVNGKGLPYRFYNGNGRPQGQAGLDTSNGHKVGDTIPLSGTIFGGANPANNAVITVESVNANGSILSARISGVTADGFVAGGRWFPPSATDLTTNS